MVPPGTLAPSDRTAGGRRGTARAAVLVRHLIKFAGGALSRWLERRLIGRPRCIPGRLTAGADSLSPGPSLAVSGDAEADRP